MKMTLTRNRTGDDGTFGVLVVEGKETFYSVEKPYVNNKPYISSIPSGKYRMIPHSSPSRGDVLCLVNDENVTHYKREDIRGNRFAILIHVANYAKDVEGCIGLGTGQTESMVTNSRVACKAFYNIVSPYEEHDIEILEEY